MLLQALCFSAHGVTQPSHPSLQLWPHSPATVVQAWNVQLRKPHAWRAVLPHPRHLPVYVLPRRALQAGMGMCVFGSPQAMRFSAMVGWWSIMAPEMLSAYLPSHIHPANCALSSLLWASKHQPAHPCRTTAPVHGQQMEGCMQGFRRRRTQATCICFMLLQVFSSPS